MQQKANKTIVFVETKRRVDEITRKLRYEGYAYHQYRLFSKMSLFLCAILLQLARYMYPWRQGSG